MTAASVLSLAGRVEVHSPIPAPGGASPEGPHIHLLPKMLRAGRTHAANAPIPEGLQPVLMLRPRSPWRDGTGRRVPFDVELDGLFQDLLGRFGLPEDIAMRAAVEEAVEEGRHPGGVRLARYAARPIRGPHRASQAERGPLHDRVEAWRRRYDRLPEAEAEAALHA